MFSVLVRCTRTVSPSVTECTDEISQSIPPNIAASSKVCILKRLNVTWKDVSTALVLSHDVHGFGLSVLTRENLTALALSTDSGQHLHSVNQVLTRLHQVDLGCGVIPLFIALTSQIRTSSAVGIRGSLPVTSRSKCIASSVC